MFCCCLFHLCFPLLYPGKLYFLSVGIKKRSFPVFSVEVPLLPLTPKTRIPIAYMILPEKSSGISLSCQTLRRSPSCPLFRRSSQKERIPRQTPRRHALISQSLRWHYPNQVRSKIYLPLSLSHKLPLALFFSVPQYSTPLFHCQRIMKHQLCTGCFLCAAGAIPPPQYAIS